jgi:hypothetical protein
MDTITNYVMEKIKALPSDATHFHLRGRTLGESLSVKVLEDIAKVIHDKPKGDSIGEKRHD